MKSNELNHSLTPIALQDLNASIAAQLESEEPSDYAELVALLSQRDTLIKAHLDSIQDDEKQNFVKMELKVNDALKQVAQSLLESSKEEIIHFVRGKAAVKKYK